MEEAITVFSGADELIACVQKCETKADAAPELDKVGQLEKMLRAVGQYGEYAQKFIELEARAYIEVARLAGSVELMKSHKVKRKLVEWLQDMPYYEQEEIFEKCREEGTRIKAQYQVWLGKQNYERRESQISQQAKQLMGEYVDCGEVIIGPSKFKGVSPEIADAVTDRVKDRLLHTGAVGVGDGRYINPTTARSAELFRKSVQIRVESIEDDIRALVALIQSFPTIELETGFGVKTTPYSECRKELLSEYPWVLASWRLIMAVDGRDIARCKEVMQLIANCEPPFNYQATVEEIANADVLPDYQPSRCVKMELTPAEFCLIRDERMKTSEAWRKNPPDIEQYLGLEKTEGMAYIRNEMSPTGSGEVVPI